MLMISINNMQNHINDIKYIMMIDEKYDIENELLIKMFYSYIKKINCYEKICFLMINKILLLIGHEKIQSFSQFKVLRNDLMKIDGEQFVLNNKELLNKFYNIGIELDFHHRRAKTLYMISIFNGILKKINFKLKGKDIMNYNKITKATVHITLYHIEKI